MASARIDPVGRGSGRVKKMGEGMTCGSHAWVVEMKERYTPCSLGLSATSQQYFSITINQPPATSQQYSSLRTNQHQPSATSQPNRLIKDDGCGSSRYKGIFRFEGGNEGI
jgi:hypothetical protein